MNVLMYDAVEKLWTKMEIKEPEIHQKSTEENNNIFAIMHGGKELLSSWKIQDPTPLTFTINSKITLL